MAIELRPLKDNEGRRYTGGTDMASMDSTDTFASCTSHPFNSQADLTRSDTELRDPNLYVNPLDTSNSRITSPSDRDGRSSQSQSFDETGFPSARSSSRAGKTNVPARTPTPRSSPRHRAKPLAYTTDSFDDTKSTDNLLGGSRSSLQDSPLPKHRRARFQEVVPRPFSRLLESVEMSRVEKSSREPTGPKSTNVPSTLHGRYVQPTLGRPEHRVPASPEKKKSILKHRDPEMEQLLPDLKDSPRPRKPRALPVQFVGIEDEDDSSRPKRVLPRSPMPPRGQRAPLADFLADFGGQEKAARDELTPENALKDTLEPPVTQLLDAPTIDHRNANTVLRCSRKACTMNTPFESTRSAEPATVCVCGSIMHQAAAAPTNVFGMDAPNIATPCLKPTISPISEVVARNDDLNNGPAPNKEADDLLFADQNSPSEETCLLQTPSQFPKGPKMDS